MSSFSDLGVPSDVADALSLRGITDPFPIQVMALPPALAGEDVCGRAPTGSGKTLAFGIPLANRVGSARRGHPKALVLAPTRELAEQIRDEFRPLLKPRNRSVATFYGGVGFGPQLKALRQGVDVAVACPGRLMDLINKREMHLDEVEIVVIDEADRMADMGFLPEVRKILDQVRPDRQTMLFSATLDGDVDVLIRHYQHNPARCVVFAEESAVDLTTHHFVDTRREDRVGDTAQLIERHGSTIVFCRTKHGTDRVTRQLKKFGVKAVPIHGGRSQNQRNRALATFADGHAQALIATDVAARGIHVDDVGCVIHFDPAGDHKDYVHRSGRTGRAGAEGVVISLVTPEDVSKVKKIQRALDMPVSGKSGGSRGGSKPKGRGGRSHKARGNSSGRKPSRNERDSRARDGEGDSSDDRRSYGAKPKSRSGQSRNGETSSSDGRSGGGKSRSRNAKPKNRTGKAGSGKPKKGNGYPRSGGGSSKNGSRSGDSGRSGSSGGRKPASAGQQR
ncbi:MAG: DEAD/DEAH box helicase [Acidobacteria bacterium]|nr:DEAD/DEAH box helicase [Acidobacteriota bacterium]